MLEMIYSADRTENSAQLLRQICRNAESGIGGQILIVPEQYSHETERALCVCGGDPISRYAEVLSFTRLAARVFSVYGGVCEEYLDENGRILTLYLAAQQVREQLKYYAAVMTRPDFLKQLGTLMEELMTSCIGPDALLDAAKQLEGRFAQKVTELALLYESYLSVCKTGRADPITRQMRLRDLLDETDYLDGRDVFIDGFSDFTALQEQILEAIVAHAKNVHVAVLTSGGQQAACQTGNETRRMLERLAARQGAETICRRAPAPTHRAPEVQAWLDGLFFGVPVQKTAPEPGVRLVQAGSQQAACAYAARMVRSGAKSGLRYRDFTICMTDESACMLPMRALLQRAGIPVYCASNAPIMEKPLVAALLAAMQAAVQYEQGAVLAFLKSGFSPLDEAEADQLEQYVYYWNIHGTLWEKMWQMHPRGLGQEMTPEDEQMLQTLNALREQAVAPLRTLRLALRAAKNVGEQARAIAAFWEELDVAGRLQAQQSRLEAAGQAQQAQECSQLYETLLTALEQLERVLGRTSMETELFMQLFTMLLEGEKVGSIPSVCDAVQLTTIPMLRHRQSRVLLVLGADDGLLPAFSDPGGLIAEPERRKLRTLGVELSLGRETAVDREMSWVCAALSAAQAHVSLVTTSAQPSFLYERTRTLFPDIRIRRAEDEPFYPDCAAAAAAVLQQPEEPDWVPETVAAEARTLSARCDYEFGTMRPETVQALYGRKIALSASKIDCFAGCRYAYFLQYGLRLKPWKQAEFDAPLFGSFVHDVLEHVVREAQAQGGFAALTDEQVSALTQTCMDACMHTYLPQGDAAAGRERYLSIRNRQEAAAIVLDVAEELRRSQFAPAAEELRFAPGGALPPIEYHARRGIGLLTGQIDRVDTYEKDGKTYFRIIDYKTGRKEFDYAQLLYGQNLQMLLYMSALETDQKRKGRPMQPTGVLYVPGRRDMIRLEPGEDASQADAERRKLLRRKGLVLNDEAILQAMEAFQEQPQYLPVRIRKDGLSGDLVTPAQLSQLERYVDQTVTQMVDALLTGQTAPNPVSRGPADSACRFCDYSSACHKDVCEIRTRRFSSVSQEEFWQEIERRMHDE